MIKYIIKKIKEQIKKSWNQYGSSIIYQKQTLYEKQRSWGKKQPLKPITILKP
jgi:hypothetical protein